MSPVTDRIGNPSDRVFCLTPPCDITHPSTVLAFTMAGSNFTEFFSFTGLERVWNTKGARACR